MAFLLIAPREARALFSSLRSATNRAAVASTARHVVAFVLALSLPSARSIALAGVAASGLRLALYCTASSLRRLAREVNGRFRVALRLLPRLTSRIIAAMMRCLPTPGVRPNPAFNPDAPSAWRDTSLCMRAASRYCSSSWRAG